MENQGIWTQWFLYLWKAKAIREPAILRELLLVEKADSCLITHTYSDAHRDHIEAKKSNYRTSGKPWTVKAEKCQEMRSSH